ncbi:MAG: transglutaminase-like cysteine peptidase [Rhodobacteraceae bacterium]|nr:transglutaminase-like cysteine peptidase [Paracoccaceae bacterium]
MFHRAVALIGLWLAVSVLPATPVHAGSSGNANATESSAFLPVGKATVPPPGFDGVCDRYAWACGRKAGVLAVGIDMLALAARINRAVNETVHQLSDYAQYGRNEYWELPTQRGGDCEDLALLKKFRLISAGVPADRLLMATVLDRQQRPHAVLVVRSQDGDFVLDSAGDRILNWRDTGYSFLRMQRPDAPSRWNAVLAGGLFPIDPSL